MPDQCTNCGFINPPGMRFCGNCGSRLIEATSTQIQHPSEPVPPNRVGAMMGADLMERFRRAGLEAAGQRRNVTILFVDISDYTQLSRKIEDEELFELIRHFIETLANDVYKYDGMVDKFTGDGLMAIFGAPIAHENNAELAVRASIDMQLDVARLSQEMIEHIDGELQVHIGLNSGSVIVGGIGSDLLMNYTAIGDTVNMAQRLEEAAHPATILVSEAVHQKTHALFEYDTAQTVALKGIATPVACYRVLRPKEKPGSVRGIEGLYAPMVGREAELRKLMQSIGALATYQQGQFVLIVGEAGLGKSRLVTELKSFTIPASVLMIEGASLTYRRTVSYWIFQDLIRNYLRVTQDASTALTSERLEQNVVNVLGKRADEILPYLEHMLSLPPSDPAASRRIEFLDAVQLRQQIFLAVRNLLIAEAQQHPLILVMEDLHWADDASLDLLQFLLESTRQAPLLILGITRPFEGGKIGEITAWAEKQLAENFVTIHLQSLTPHQSNQLLQRLLTISELPEELREHIIQRASGIPFYLEEILRMFIDAGVVQRENSHWRLVEGVDISSLGVPDSLQSLIMARFDRLEPAQRHMLQVACVIGRQFSLPVLRTVLDSMSENEFTDTLSHLVERDFIHPLPEAPESEYNFRHVIVSDAIYNTLLRRDRRMIHGQVGEVIEKIYADRLEGQVDLLARHFSWSAKKDRALHYLILAGQKAARSYLNNQALKYFEEAQALLSQISYTPHQALDISMGIGDVMLLTGEYPTARERYQQALETISAEEAAQFVEERSSLQRKISTTYERQGDYDEALRLLAQAERTLDEADGGYPAEKAQIRNDIGWIHYRHSDFEAAEKYLVDALVLAEGTNRYDITASIYNRLGGVCYRKEHIDLAVYYTQQSLKLREEIGDIVAVARSYNNLGLLSWKSGEWDNAIAYFTRSLELHANLGDVEGSIELRGNLSLLQSDRGNIDEALKHLQESLSIAQQIGHRYHEGNTYHYLSRLYLSTNDWRLALEYANHSLEVFTEIGDRENLVDVYTHIGRAYLGMGNQEMANKWVQEALTLFAQLAGEKAMHFAEPRGRALRLLGDLTHSQGDFAQAKELLQESSTIFRAVGDQLEEGRTILAQARLAATCDNLTEMQTLLEQARAIFQKLGAHLDLQQLERLAQTQPTAKD